MNNLLLKLITSTIIITSITCNLPWNIPKELTIGCRDSRDDIVCVKIDKEKDTFKFFQDNFPEFIEVMLKLKMEGYLTNDDISKIDKYISQITLDASMEVPYTDKDLVDFLYDSNIITKAQYDRILELIDED